MGEYATKKELKALQQRVAKEVKALQQRFAKMERYIHPDSTTKAVPQKKKSQRETFLEYTLAKSGINKCLVIMSILDNEQEEGFTLEDIREMYKKVKEKPPKNLSDTIAQLQKKGFVDVLEGEGGSREYIVTNSGASAVKDFLNNEENI